MGRRPRRKDPESAPDDGRLSDRAVAEVLALIPQADSVEIKLTVPATARRATIAGLPLDPVEAQPRQVFFFDTPDLDLDRAGVIVRARRIQGGRGDTVVKVRPVVPASLSPRIRKTASVEIDVLPGGVVCSASVKGKATGTAIRGAVEGTIPIRKLFSKDQREAYELLAPGGLPLDELTPLGPIFLLKATFAVSLSPGDAERRMVAELWLYPDGSAILELSTKCPPADAFTVAASLRTYLTGLGIPIGAGQQTKTRAALDFFKAHPATTATAAPSA
jgi:hypothetical protein